MLSTLYSARHNHLGGGLSGVAERSKQLTAHIDFESCALESVDDPANALAKLLSLRIAPG
jgi:hypothetical protein